ncbi:MAG: hypothetical protein CL931_04170 [Deltaproteobacteria bacterium]|nr:hypothetical protein [Deltaproteobacteria bacterium]
MRILHALHDYLPEQVAGIEVYTNRVAHDQARQHEVGILFARLGASASAGDVETSVEGAVSLFALAQDRRWHRFERTWLDPRVEPGIERGLDAFRPDVVHVQHLGNLGLSLPRIARRRGIPVVMTLHDHWLSCASGGQRFHADRTRCEVLDESRCGACVSSQIGPALRMRGARQRARLRRAASAVPVLDRSPSGDDRDAPSPTPTRPGRSGVAKRVWTSLVRHAGQRAIEARWSALRAFASEVDLFVSPSGDMRRGAIEFGLEEGRCLHVPHGLSLEGEVGRPPAERARRFGYVGSIVPHKGVHDLVRAFETLPEDARLDLWGSLDDAPAYVAEVRAWARHPGIRFRGEARPNEVAGHVAALDAVIVPSVWRENAPLSILEALALGRPVVASRVGGHPELLGALEPLLFEPGDVPALAAVLRRLADEPGFARSMAERVPRVPPIEEHTAALEAIYRRVGPGSAFPRDGSPS